MSGPTSSLTPWATIFSVSMSRPESVLSSTAMRGFSIAICRISTLLLSAREAVVQVAHGELPRHLQVLHLRQELGAELLHRDRVVLAAGARLAQALSAERRKLVTVTPGIAWVLEGGRAPLRAFVGPHLNDVLPVEQDLAARDLVGRVAHDRVGQGGLAGAVRAHDGMRLARVHGEVDTLTISVPSSSATQVLELQLCHFVLPDSFQVMRVFAAVRNSWYRSRQGAGFAPLGWYPEYVPFGIQLWELGLLLVVLLVFGPKRLPEMGRSLGKGCGSSRIRSPARTTLPSCRRRRKRKRSSRPLRTTRPRRSIT